MRALCIRLEAWKQNDKDLAMKQLGRALRMTLKYRWSLIGSIVCSLMVAILWGANLGAVYPFVEIVLQNKTLPQWAEQRIEESTTRIAEHEQRIATIRGSVPAAGNVGSVDVVRNPVTSTDGADIRAIKYELKAERSRLATTRYCQPLILSLIHI